MDVQLAPFRRDSIVECIHQPVCLCTLPFPHSSSCLLPPSPPPSKMGKHLSPKLMTGLIYNFDDRREHIYLA